MDNYSYLGKAWAYPPRLDAQNKMTVVVEKEENIKQSLWNLLSTSPGERVHHYDYGCPIRKYVFEVMDTTTQTLIREEIEKSIILFEPRITLNAVALEFNQTEGIMRILLDYTIRQTNRRSNMVYPFYLNEGTDLKLENYG
ncbi:GPW/gp25 family protein [Bacteroides sp.]|uniref:GPW/gp25 family protein n=1 Tax=Bacteroides sp. TaxID=29523 RepID=UPI00260F1C22|nr:GPW/gp25 family protein [Bacteroides sp.]MDD3038141.1 GPW/gp25 family protein [Bacteroides sp.]